MNEPLTKGQRVLLFITVALATFMMVLDYSIANIAIPYIAGDLAVSTDEGTYVITSFAVGNAIGLIMTGWLTKRVERSNSSSLQPSSSRSFPGPAASRSA